MTRNEAAIARAKELLGNGYIYGATGWVCTAARREQQAAQYPQYRTNILEIGAKWDGVVCWDCAQFTKTVAKAAGMQLPSGASAQWNTAAWVAKGDAATIPTDVPCFLYRRQSGSTSSMQHTGFALGDGTFIHAKGTRDGVVRERLDDFGWTHWATLWDADAEVETPDVPAPPDECAKYDATVVAENGKPVKMRFVPGGDELKKVPVGTVVQVLGEVDADWARIRCGDTAGYMMRDFLRAVPSAEEQTYAATLPSSYSLMTSGGTAQTLIERAYKIAATPKYWVKIPVQYIDLAYTLQGMLVGAQVEVGDAGDDE